MGDATGSGEKITASRSFNIVKPYKQSSKQFGSPQSKSSNSINVSPCKDYFKRFELDKIPVKDVPSCGEVTQLSEGGDCKLVTSLTNSFLDRLEKKVAADMQDVEYLTNNVKTQRENVTNGQIDIESKISLDSHVRFFKTTVEEIFDTFYTTLNDIETYKKRYHEILEKNATNSIDEMEKFIKDIIQHIMSSESSHDSFKSDGTYDVVFVDSNNNDTAEPVDDNAQAVEAPADTNDAEYAALEKVIDDSSNKSIFEAYKNNKFANSSNQDSIEFREKEKKCDFFSIYLLSNAPAVEIRLADRQMQSEINVKDKSSVIDSKVISADDLKRAAAKRQELEVYQVQQQEGCPDRDIPIKFSSPKKNLYLNEDFCTVQEKIEKSLISKLCGYICKKLRRNPI